VPSIRFRLDNPTPENVLARVREEYGENARIVSASEVRVGGIGGFFARRFVEVDVDVMPDARNVAGIVADVLAAPRQSLGAAVRPSPAVGIEALLEAADRAEGHPDLPTPVLLTPVSTQSDRFDRLLDDLNSYATRATPAPVITATLVPELYDQPGGLVLFVGLANDSISAVRSLTRSARRAKVHLGGRILDDDIPRVDDRRAAASARAKGVADNSVALVAWGLGIGMSEIPISIAMIRQIAPDQVWLVVDASRKPEDTAAWVTAIRRAFPVTALAVVSSVETATPNSINALGLPVGWSETVG
jgi:hypothetical protein